VREKLFRNLFCPTGQNEHDIKECDAQIPDFIKNLRSRTPFGAITAIRRLLRTH